MQQVLSAMQCTPIGWQFSERPTTTAAAQCWQGRSGKILINLGKTQFFLDTLYTIAYLISQHHVWISCGILDDGASL